MSHGGNRREDGRDSPDNVCQTSSGWRNLLCGPLRGLLVQRIVIPNGGFQLLISCALVGKSSCECRLRQKGGALIHARDMFGRQYAKVGRGPAGFRADDLVSILNLVDGPSAEAISDGVPDWQRRQLAE